MQQQEHLDSLRQIHAIMERSSRFTSLSGLSGILTGMIALVGSVALYRFTGTSWDGDPLAGLMDASGQYDPALLRFLVTDALVVLGLSLSVGLLLTGRRARSEQRHMLDATARRLAYAFFVPMLAGGALCLILLQARLAWMLPAVSLLFYGMALFSGAKYSFREIGYQGICVTALGLAAAALPRYAMLCWALGFGLLHILTGLVLYLRYQRAQPAAWQ